MQNPPNNLLQTEAARLVVAPRCLRRGRGGTLDPCDGSTFASIGAVSKLGEGCLYGENEEKALGNLVLQMQSKGRRVSENVTVVQKYPAPPIFDAILELRLSREFSAKEIALASAAFAKGYEKHEVQNSVKVEVRLSGEAIQPHLSDPQPVHIFSNSDQTDHCRIESDRMHWSRLPPYEGWDPFCARIFSDIAKLPKKIGLPALTRVGLRYRNRIDVPMDNGVGHYEDFLEVNISLPDILDKHQGYEWRILKEFEAEGLAANLTSGVIESPMPKCAGVLLDIDVFCTEDLPSSVGELAARLEQMRAKKNEIFEVCMTDKARATFQ